MAGSIPISYNGHFYSFTNVALSYADAKLAASNSTYNGFKGHLLTITNSAEQNFIISNASSLGLTQTGFIWLGLENRVGTSGSWLTGEAFTYAKWATTSYTGAGFETRAEAVLVGTDIGTGRATGDWIAWGSSGQSASYIIEYENNPPTITSATSASTFESISSGTIVYTATATDPDANTTLTYSLSGGADPVLFNINASSGAVTFKTSPNFDAPADAGANNVYDLTIRASDGVVSTDKSVAISVMNINESPSFTSHRTSMSLSGATYRNDVWSVSFSGDINKTISYQVTPSDESGSNISNAANALADLIRGDAILASKYSVAVDAAQNGTVGISLQQLVAGNIAISAAVIDATPSTSPLLIDVSPTNEFLVRTSLLVSGATYRNDVWSVSFSGDINKTISYQATPNDETGSNISNVANALANLIRGDAILASKYSVTVDAAQNGTVGISLQQLVAGNIAISAAVIDATPSTSPLSASVNPIFRASTSVLENLSTSTPAYTATATDPDAGATLTYSISGGADAAIFNINASTGAVTFKASPNFEAPADSGANNVYDITVRASDGSLYADKAVAITVTNANEAPAITSAATASTAENVSTTIAVYTATATDPDANTTLTYSISGGADAALFNINASTGAVTFKTSPNYEAPTDSGANNVYDITVQASDGALTASKAVAITVTDVVETPPTFKFTSSATLGVNENVSVGGSIYGAAASIPGVVGTVVYSVTGGADAASFAIDAATGALSFKSSPDYEAAGDAGANNVYELGLRAVETTAAPSSAEIQVRNALWSAAGQVTAEVWAKASGLEGFDLVIGATGGSGLSFSQAALSGWTVMPNAMNGEVLVSGYSLAPLGTGPVLLGTISAQATGAEFHLLIKDGTDAQAAGNMVKVAPYDIAFYQATQALAITVNNVNEAPVITSASTASTPENALTSQAVYTAAATDPDGNTTFTYSISGGADASLFQIDSHTGAVTFKASPDFEAPADAGANNVYDITIRASDGALYAEKAVAINVTDVFDSGSLHGETYFWKANASGQHALLSGVTVNAAGGDPPSEGGNAPIQLKNITWDASGHATADIYAHVTGSADSFDLHLGFGGATGVNFTSALSSDWTLLTNQVQNEYLISGYSLTALAAGDVKVGSIAFETGQLAQMHIGVDAGSRMGSVTATAYGYSLAHDTSGSSGAYSITPIDAGSYALTAIRGITDIGTAINSADALAALKIAVGLNPNPTTNGTQLAVSPFQIMAADINGDGRVNSADALAILKVAVHLSTAVTPQWVFVEDTRDFYDEATGLFTLTKSAASWDHSIRATVLGETTENLVGVLMGDVNGSWTPPAGSQYVETLNPTYFTDLANKIHTPVSEWGVL